MGRLNLFILLGLLIQSCGAPTNNRSFTTANSTSGDGITDKGDDPSSTSGETTGGTSELGPGFENCVITPNQYAPEIGYAAVCQSTQQETFFKVQFDKTDYNEQTCLIPMTTYDGGASRYIGNGQCLYTEKDKTYEGYLYKFQSEATSPLDSVIVIKERALVPFRDCMNALLTCPVASSSLSYQQCHNSSQALLCQDGPNLACFYRRDQLCEAFTSQYSFLEFVF